MQAAPPQPRVSNGTLRVVTQTPAPPAVVAPRPVAPASPVDIAVDLAMDNPHVRVVDNPTGTTPDGLNLAIAASRHPVVVRVDAHGELGEGYLETAVALLHQTDAANVGGRMIGTSAALLTTTMAGSMPGASPSHQMAYAAAVVALVVYAVGFAASFWLPEPGRSGLIE